MFVVHQVAESADTEMLEKAKADVRVNDDENDATESNDNNKGETADNDEEEKKVRTRLCQTYEHLDRLTNTKYYRHIVTG
jgi:hypothetical protein